MKTAKISLNSIDKVKAFVNEISKFDCDFDLVSGRYVIDAKSIMGIFSLDLSKPIDLNILISMISLFLIPFDNPREPPKRGSLIVFSYRKTITEFQ